MADQSSKKIPLASGAKESSLSPHITMKEMFRKLGVYEGPFEGFLSLLLRLQVRTAKVRAGAILRVSGEGSVDAIITEPAILPNTTPPVWLKSGAELVREVLQSDRTVVRGLHYPEDLYGAAPKEHLVLVPLPSMQSIRSLAVFHVDKITGKPLAETVERLELVTTLIRAYELRLGFEKKYNDLKRLRVAMDTLSATNGHRRFRGVVMAMCNEISSQWQCERVSIGMLEGRYIKLKGMSGTEKFSRKMKLVQEIEAAMEECGDQNIEIEYPGDPNATYVNRSARELSKKHSAVNVISFPLRRDGHVECVVTVERDQDKPFSSDEIEEMRLLCELCTARLIDLSETDHWFGKKLALNSKRYLSLVVGPKHSWAKFAAILISCFLVFVFFFKGQYSAEGKITVTSQTVRVIPTPFDGILDSVDVKIGDKVQADMTILAKLDTAELREQLATAKVERQQSLKSEAEAMRDKKTVEAQIARQDVLKAEAKIRLFQNRIDNAIIKSPISGTVIEGDLERHTGRRIQLGDALFQVARLDSMYAEILIDEDQISDVRKGQIGELATLASPGQHLKFVVERIDPVAKVVEQKNVYKVRAKLLETDQTLVPGLTGFGKIHIDKRPYAYIWTRKIINWIRMKLWV